MISTLLAKVIGTKNERELKRLQPQVAETNRLEPEMRALSDEQLGAKTPEFKAELVQALEGLEGKLAPQARCRRINACAVR